MSSGSESDAANDQQISGSDDDQGSNTSHSSDNGGDIASRLRSSKKNPAPPEVNPCVKLMLPEHLAAYMEERDLDRDVEPIECSAEMVEKIFGNYLIVKNILSHLRWQEKMISKDVCPLWNSAIKRLQVEQIEPVDFSINASFNSGIESIVMLKSSEFYTEPMVVFIFCTAMAYHMCSINCTGITPGPCTPPCGDEHSILDYINREMIAPRDCMYSVKASSISYMPLPHAPTVENTIKKAMQGSDAGFYGIFIPKIPDVEFKLINFNCSNGIQEDLLPEIKKVTEKYTVKGVIACLTENYLLYANENAECLAFLNTMQPETPFAFGGCLVEDTVNDVQDILGIVDGVNKNKEFVSGNIMSLGLFVRPKTENSSPDGELKHNFEAYSFILESAEWSKQAISHAIQKFSESVPRFEHSFAFKFSCMGRQHKHEAEQHYFRMYFPHTRFVGCFGNGELGVNHPSRDSDPKAKNTAKRSRYLAYEKVHSYSTVFFYVGWGKLVEEAERDD